MKDMKKLTKIIILIGLLIFITGCGQGKPENEVTNISGFYFDTYITINIYDSIDDQTIKGLSELLTKYDTLFSEDNENSDIYRLNHSDKINVTMNPETISVLNTALEFAYLSDGAFDPSIEAVQKLWCFDGSNNTPPLDEDIKRALKNVDYTCISVDTNTISLSPEQEITLGASAKGYIADQIRKYLYDNNIENALIDLGGNILCMGSKDITSKNIKPFKIGIKKPFSDEAITSVEVTNNSIVTSGVYERSYIYNDKLYHHILDTQTGYPVSLTSDNGKQLYSVSIIGPSSEICDNLSTCLLLLGPDKGNALLNNYNGYNAIYVYDDNTIEYSNNYNVSSFNNITLEKIMFLGDSITYGYCPGYPEGGFRNVINDFLENDNKQALYDFVGDINAGDRFDNDCCGYSGYTIAPINAFGTYEKDSHGLSEITNKMLYTYYPDTIVLMIGTNDILRCNGPKNMNQNIDELVNQILLYTNNDKHLFICSIPYVSCTNIADITYIADATLTQDDINTKTDGYNNHLEALANSHDNITFIDINKALTFDDLVDGIHPSLEGYEKIGALIYKNVFIAK